MVYLFMRAVPLWQALQALLVVAFAALTCASKSSGFGGGSEPRKLINGGNIVWQDQVDSTYPWFVFFVEIDNGECQIPMCGGAMVAPGTVLSAAHCFADAGGINLKNLFAVIGFAGRYDKTKNGWPSDCNQASLQVFARKSAQNAMVVAINDIRKPIHFHTAWGFDVVLAFLDECAHPSINMPTVKLQGLGGDDAKATEEMQFTLLGFGAMMGEKGQMSTSLKKLDASVTGIGTSDESCNVNVAKESRVVPGACSPETRASGCEGALGDNIPNGCRAGKKAASGDSGGPWVTLNNGSMIHVFVQSSGVEDNSSRPYSFLIRNAWFQDWILEGVKAFDTCGGSNLHGSDIFKDYAASPDQYCQGRDCLKCMDNSTVSMGECKNHSKCRMKEKIAECRSPGGSGKTKRPRIASTVNGAHAIMLEWCAVLVIFGVAVA